MNNWIEDGHGNKWHRCKLGADCGLKVIEAGKARCWCQDQEASRDKVQSAREQIRCLETDNDRLREEVKAAKIDRDLAGWDDYAVIAELKRENAALQEDKERLDWLERRSVSRLDWVITIFETNNIAVREAIDAARKEAQP